MSDKVIDTVLGYKSYITWIIPSFDLLFQKKDCRIYSPTTYTNYDGVYVQSPWPSLRYIKTLYRKEFSNEWMGLIVAGEDNKEPPILNIRFEFVDEKNDETKYYTAEWVEDPDEHYKYFIVPKFLEKRMSDPGYYDKRVVKLKGHLFCEILSKQVPKDVSTQTENENDLERLSQSLKELYIEGKDSDLIIKVKDREFKAHRAILRSRSPVFDNMFLHGLSENYSDTVPIEDCEPDAFEEFLFFIYSGREQHISSDNVCNLYYISDKYDMPDLKEKCISFLKNSLTIEIICDVICLSTKHSETELLEHAIKFFARNIEAILVTVKWQLFLKENPTEANELYIRALKLGFRKLDI